MEDSGFGTVLIYLIIAAVTIISAVVSGRNKKRTAQNTPAPKPVNFPEIDESLKDFFPKNDKNIINTDSVETIEEDKPDTESFINFNEVKDSHKITPNTTKKEISKEESEIKQDEKFDPVKAIIYSEILNRKY